MLYKVSGLNWLCVRNDADSKWTTVFQLSEDQARDLKRAIKSIKSKSHQNTRDSLVKTVDIINDR